MSQAFVTTAIPTANPQSENLVFGMVTNGEDYVFIKASASLSLELTQQGVRQYDLSDKFTLAKRHTNELGEVLQGMKQIAGLIR